MPMDLVRLYWGWKSVLVWWRTRLAFSTESMQGRNIQLYDMCHMSYIKMTGARNKKPSCTVKKVIDQKNDRYDPNSVMVDRWKSKLTPY